MPILKHTESLYKNVHRRFYFETDLNVFRLHVLSSSIDKNYYI